MNMDNDFRLVFRKITKKDSLTKQKVCFLNSYFSVSFQYKLIKIKGLEEYKVLIETKSVESCVSVISYWTKLYTKLSIVR
jgi:hypothetical protein